MPRKKLIDEENIKFEKIDTDIIERKTAYGLSWCSILQWGKDNCIPCGHFIKSLLMKQG